MESTKSKGSSQLHITPSVQHRHQAWGSATISASRRLRSVWRPPLAFNLQRADVQLANACSTRSAKWTHFATQCVARTRCLLCLLQVHVTLAVNASSHNWTDSSASRWPHGSRRADITHAMTAKLTHSHAQITRIGACRAADATANLASAHAKSPCAPSSRSMTLNLGTGTFTAETANTTRLVRRWLRSMMTSTSLHSRATSRLTHLTRSFQQRRWARHCLTR